MRKQDQLSALINSLGKNEKRYFKLQASLHSGDKTFIRLFDELSKNNEYDPELLSKKLKISKPLLAHTKKYLEKVLLGSLRNYDQDNLLNISLSNQWQEVQILYTRSQHELALSVCEKALEEALKYEDFIAAYNLGHNKYTLLMYLSRFKEAEETAHETDLYAEKMYEVHLLRSADIMFNNIALGTKPDKQEIKKITQLPGFRLKPEQLKSNSAKIRWHRIQQLDSYYFKRDYEKAIYHLQHQVQLYETQPQFIYATPRAYLLCLTSLIHMHCEIRNFEEALKASFKLERVTSANRNGIPTNLRNYYNLVARRARIYIFQHMERYHDAIKAMEEVMHELPTVMPIEAALDKLQYVHALFFAGKFEAAQKVCEEIQDSGVKIHMQLSYESKILLIMVHHALKNYSLLPHYINAFESWIKRHKLNMPGLTRFTEEWLRKLGEIKSEHDNDLFFKKIDEAMNKTLFSDYGIDINFKRWVKNNLHLKSAAGLALSIK